MSDTPRIRPADRRPKTGEDDRPVLPERAREDSDEAWGERGGGRDADWYRRERPPHHE